jgi:hypothetical protein
LQIFFSANARIFENTRTHVLFFHPSSAVVVYRATTAGEKEDARRGRRKSSAATVGTGRWVRGYLARARRDETERFGLEVFLRSEQVGDL